MQNEIKRYDGKADIITLGALPCAFVTLHSRREFRDAMRLVSSAKKTPVIDGEEYREWIEPFFWRQLIRGKVILPEQKVLFPLGAGRLSCANVLHEAGFKNLTFGDFIYDLELPVPPFRSLATIDRVSVLISPILTKLPFLWIYPTGEKQEQTAIRRPDLFQEADIIAGDFHNIRRYLPQLEGEKIIITNTVTAQDRKLLKERGLYKLITLSPNFDGRTFGSNLTNGIIRLLADPAGKPVSQERYMEIFEKLQWKPEIEILNKKTYERKKERLVPLR